MRALLLSSRFRRARLRLAFAAYTLVLIVGSIPGARAEIGNIASGLILHSVAYACLTLLLFTGTLGSALQRAARAVLAVAVMGALDEYVQHFFPYRHASVGDWAVDVCAALVAATLLWAFWPRARD